jgi:hypothetical protein
MKRREFLKGAVALAAAPAAACAARGAGQSTAVRIESPMSPPEWALLQRQLLHRESEACAAFYQRYFDARGRFQCVERWGADDGPDDAIENCNGWPLLHALGGADQVMSLYTRAWEGHLEQYTAARTVQTEIARGGMYYREFPVMNDWQHISEFLSVFNVMGLSDARNRQFRERLRRYASFYIGEDREADNYDARRRLIKSLINGSRGPLLRKATAMDWAGDPFDPSGFSMAHGERSFEEVLAHFAEYGDVVGDNPLNLQSTSLVLNAYMLTGERKYRDWIESYLDGWMQRARQNGGVLPSHVDLEGRIGGAAGAWYGSVYGWGFSPIVPQTGKREDRNRVPRAVVAFMNAYLMSGDDRYLQVWRTQNEVINSQARTIDGVREAPTMYGRRPDGSIGWYSYKPGPYRANGLEIWYLSMRDDDFRSADTDHPWIRYLRGTNPQYPVRSLQDALEAVRARLSYLQDQDRTTPQTRLSDALLDYNPAVVTPLIHLMCGGIHVARPPWSATSPNQGGAPLYARLRYFDPAGRRAGIPPDTAALVSQLTDTSTTVTLVNLDPVRPRRVTVQAGAYGEHEFTGVDSAGTALRLAGRRVTIDLAPGAGGPLTLSMRRHVNAPTLNAPWDG